MTTAGLPQQTPLTGTPRVPSAHDDALDALADRFSDTDWDSLGPERRADLLGRVSDRLLSSVDPQTGYLAPSLSEAATVFYSFAVGLRSDQSAELSVEHGRVVSGYPVPRGAVGLDCTRATDTITLARHCAGVLAAGDRVVVLLPETPGEHTALLLAALHDELPAGVVEYRVGDSPQVVLAKVFPLDVEHLRVAPSDDRFRYADTATARVDRRTLTDRYSDWRRTVVTFETAPHPPAG